MGVCVRFVFTVTARKHLHCDGHTRELKHHEEDFAVDDQLSSWACVLTGSRRGARSQLSLTIVILCALMINV